MVANRDMTTGRLNKPECQECIDCRRFFRYFVSWILVPVAFLVVSCGEVSNTTSGKESTGAISFELEWDKGSGNISESTASNPEAVPQICTDQGIQTIYADIQISTGTSLVSANWPCEVGSGTIEKIPVGSNYILKVDGRDSGGVVKGTGQIAGLEIIANTTKAAGKVTITKVPTTCPTGQQLVGNTCQTITCPTGQQLVGNACQPIICSTGWQLSGNTCLPLPSNQLWNIESTTAGTITATHSGLYLAVDSTGRNVSQLTSAYNWRFVPTPAGSKYYQIISNANNKCLDVENGSTSNNANVQVFSCGEGDNQVWSLNKLSEGYTQIINKKSGKCLDVVSASTLPGANVQQYTCR
jgi:hypothetical protein